MKTFLLTVSLMILSFIAGVNKDKIGETLQKWQDRLVTGNTEDEIKTLPILLAEVEAKAKGVDNYTTLMNAGKTGKSPDQSLEHYKTLTLQLKEDVHRYGCLRAKYLCRDASIPEAKQHLRPIDAPTAFAAK